MVVGWLINVTSFHKRGLLVIGCDIANYKPDLLLEYLLHVSCDGCQTACSPI